MVLAEAGADYVGFGAPPHLKDRDKARVRREELIAWWAPIFEVPCVAFDVETGEEAAQLAAAGADFFAVALTADLTAKAARSAARGWPAAIAGGEPDNGLRSCHAMVETRRPRFSDSAVARLLLGAAGGRGGDQLLGGPRRSRRADREGKRRRRHPSGLARHRHQGRARHPRGRPMPALTPRHGPARPRRPPAEEDPAYEAFEQGYYMTALELAVKAPSGASRRPTPWSGASMRRGSARRPTRRWRPSGSRARPSWATRRPCSPWA